jgi:hypothetical protein
MGFGKLRRIWEKIKGGIKSVWNKGIKPAFKALAPIAGTVGTAVGGAFGGPAGAVEGAKIGGIAGSIMNGLSGGGGGTDSNGAAIHLNSFAENGKKSAVRKVPAWLKNA